MEQEIKRIDLNGVNSYLLKQGGSFILVDTGGHLNMDADFNNRRGMLKMQLDHAGCTPENLKLILLTHGDSDHVTNVSYLMRNMVSGPRCTRTTLRWLSIPPWKRLWRIFISARRYINS